MWQIVCCLCTRSWSVIECCACCYCFYKVKNCCKSLCTKISNCFKDCYNGLTKCCTSEPPNHTETVPSKIVKIDTPTDTPIHSEVVMGGIPPVWPEEA